jgi:hypothetical protein
MKSCRTNIGVLVVSLATLATTANARTLGQKAQAMIEALLAPPTIKTEPGVSRQNADPARQALRPTLFMLPRGDAAWINDDGRAIGDHGSRISAIKAEGKISVLMGADKLLPVLVACNSDLGIAFKYHEAWVKESFA